MNKRIIILIPSYEPDNKLIKLVEQKKIERCELCHNKMQYVASGIYRCTVCGIEVLDDFGKIKQFLDQQ